MPPESTTHAQLMQLVHRRAVLLDEVRDGSQTAAVELDELTTQLLAAAEGRPLVVRRLTRDEPGDLLDRLVASEPVHPFEEGGRWSVAEQLADRLDDDRRCYVLEHPLLVGVPLNIVWVALTQGIPTLLGPILDPESPTLDPVAADTATFFSIWNVEPGLVGIPGGRSLLAGAIAELRSEFDQLAEFVTLSPIPGFRRWWESEHGEAKRAGDPEHGLMERACARYLTTYGENGRLLDAVARFHLGNGARLWQLDWQADVSERGLRRSFGLMANYHYDPEDRRANRSSLRSGAPTVGPAVASLLDDSK